MLLALFTVKTVFLKCGIDKLGYINSDLIYESKLSITTVDSVHPLQTIEDSPNCVNFQNLSDRNYDVS